MLLSRELAKPEHVQLNTRLGAVQKSSVCLSEIVIIYMSNLERTTSLYVNISAGFNCFEATYQISEVEAAVHCYSRVLQIVGGSPQLDLTGDCKAIDQRSNPLINRTRSRPCLTIRYAEGVSAKQNLHHRAVISRLSLSRTLDQAP